MFNNKNLFDLSNYDKKNKLYDPTNNKVIGKFKNECPNTQITNFTAMFETDGKNVIPYIVYDDKQWLMSLTSGFERFVLSLAIRIALVNISNLPRPSFLIIDEGFGVLDSENLPSMHILFSYLKANFDFILVISHLEALRDMVDMQIEITKDNGFSKINMA